MIPVWYFVVKFIEYYYPLINSGVPQGPKRKGRNTNAFETFFNNLKQESVDLNFLMGVPETIKNLKIISKKRI